MSNPKPIQEIKPTAKGPVWCVVANVAEETRHGPDDEVREGLKHFNPNAKLYCFPAMWGDGYENVKVIGHHRGSGRIVKMVIPSRHLVNWRAKLCYSPKVLQLFEEDGAGWTDSDESRRQAEELAVMANGRLSPPKEPTSKVFWLDRIRAWIRRI